MRKNVLTTLMILSAVICTVSSYPLKVQAIPKADTDITDDLVNEDNNKNDSPSAGNSASIQNSTFVQNSTVVQNNNFSINEARNILMAADGAYINSFLSSKKNAFLNYDRKIDKMNIHAFYDIIDEPCYVFSLTYDYSDLFIAANSIYYVGMNSKKVYVINGTDAPYYSYELSSGSKVKTFPFKGSQTCNEWHN